MDMHVIVDTGDDELDHLVDGRARVHLCADPHNERLWTIWKIEDAGGKCPRSTEPSTWTQIKAMFR